VFTLALTTASDAFQLLLSIGAGTGLIYLLRWFWWRINAWSEIAAMISSFVIAVAMLVARRAGVPISDSAALIASVAFTTVVWVAVTLLTPPTDQATLIRFYECTRPGGPGPHAAAAVARQHSADAAGLDGGRHLRLRRIVRHGQFHLRAHGERDRVRRAVRGELGGVDSIDPEERKRRRLKTAPTSRSSIS